MSEYITGVTASGGEWTPTFIVGNNIDSCVSCAKCFKACGRGVFEQVEHPDKDGMCGAMVMGISHPEECIGCGACARSCPRRNIKCEPKFKA